MKKITILLVLVGVGVGVAMSWKGLMTSFMTASVDETSEIKLESLTGTMEATRYVPGKNNEKGNETPLALKAGMALQTNDKLISGGNDTRMVLALDAQNRVEIRSADLILKQLFGQKSQAFRVNVEEGWLRFDIKERGDRQIRVVDTNKDGIDLTSGTGRYYIGATSFEETLNVFVDSGTVQVSNTKKSPGKPVVTAVKAGEGLEIAADGTASKVGREASWVAALTW